MAIGIGIALGTASVFLRELFDRTFRHPARVRQSLGIPVLETIGEIRVGIVTRWWGRHRMLPACAVVETVAILAVSLLVYMSLQEPAKFDRLFHQAGQVWPI